MYIIYMLDKRVGKFIAINQSRDNTEIVPILYILFSISLFKHEFTWYEIHFMLVSFNHVPIGNKVYYR